MDNTDPSLREPRRIDHSIHFFFTNKFVDYLATTTDVKKKDAYVLFDGGEVPGSQADVFDAEYRRILTRDIYLAKKDTSSNALFSTLLYVNRKYVTQWVIFTIFHVAARLVSAAIVVFYVRQAQPGESAWSLWVVGMAVVVIVLLEQICIGCKTWASENLMYNFRYQLPNLIYKKILSLNGSSIAGVSRGSLINMAIGDMRALDMAVTWGLYAPASLVEVVAIFIILATTVSPVAAIAGVVMILLVVPIQMLSVAEIGKCKRAVSQLSDERLRLTSEAIQGILTIKSQCWEEPMIESLLAVRRKEMVYVQRIILLRIFNANMAYFFLPVAILLMEIAYSYMDNTLTPTVVFLILGYALIPRVFLMYFFVLSAQCTYDAKIAVDRLNNFMEIAEPPPPPNMIEQAPHLPKGTIAMNGVDYDWDFTLGKKPQRNGNGNGGGMEAALLSDPPAEVVLALPTLAGVQLEIQPGELLAIAGTVGSGKSSLFAALLGELQPMPPSRSAQSPPAEPALRQPVVIGSVAYAPQSPWLFAGTVRDNILFGLEYNEQWYATVVAACALTSDFSILPAGDGTVLGPNGMGLSGGQKARVGLARAVYMKADITLLDDPLSALDARVARHVFDHVIGPKGILRNSTRLLATHLRAYFHYCDRTLVLREGRVIALGTWNELKGRGIDELNVNSFEDTGAVAPVETESGAEEASEADQAADDGDASSESERHFSVDQMSSQLPSAQLPEVAAQAGQIGPEAPQPKLNGSLLYVAALGGLTVPIFILILRALSEASFNLSLYWAAFSSESGTISPLDYGIFGLLVGVVIILSTVAVFILPNIFVRASTVLHEGMVRSIFGTHFSFFLTKTGKGSVTDCVARDVAIVDDFLPLTLNDLVVQLMAIVASVVIWIVAIPYMAIVSVFFLGVVAYVWIKFSKAYATIGRFGAMTSAPITNSFLIAESGLPIIRTTNSEERLKQEFKQSSIDAAIWNLAGHCTVKWMNVRIAYAAAFSTLIFVILAVVLNSQISYILVALVLYSMIGLGQMVPNIIRFASVVLAGTQGVERITAFSILPQEDAEHEKAAFEAGEKLKTPEGWPGSALVEFDDVSVSYNPTGPLVLKNLSMVMRPGSSVCVIGRTGSGKSTLILSLFRMVSIRHGTLLFDGVDTATIPLKMLRAQMAIIPQEPVMFSGTIRSNLDPWGLVSDDQIWAMLRQVGLFNLTSDMGGLDTPVSENQKISLGQKQLMCLARAFLKDAWLIALDEATASMDLATEAAVQTTLKSWTSAGDVGRLLLVVAHRLSATESADQLLVLSEGQLVEEGNPAELAERSDGYYSSMLAAMRAVAKS